MAITIELNWNETTVNGQPRYEATYLDYFIRISKSRIRNKGREWVTEINFKQENNMCFGPSVEEVQAKALEKLASLISKRLEEINDKVSMFKEAGWIEGEIKCLTLLN